MRTNKRDFVAIRDDLEPALMTLGWSQQQLADRLKVHKNTVSAWATGRVGLPGPVEAYLDLAVRASRLLG